MSDLSSFRDHARAMSTAEHKPECTGTPERIASRERDRRGYRAIFREEHPKLPPLEPCLGCVTDTDRALWLRLADEVDAYLTHDEEGLFA